MMIRPSLLRLAMLAACAAVAHTAAAQEGSAAAASAADAASTAAASTAAASTAPASAEVSTAASAAVILPQPTAANPLVKIDTVVGTGKEAGVGSNIVVNYTGWFYKPMAARQRGRKFDSSLDAGRDPLEFQLGAGKVIKGWDQGVVGMKVGGKRTLIIPSDMAYGKRGAGSSIPPDADLIFDVELLKVK